MSTVADATPSRLKRPKSWLTIWPIFGDPIGAYVEAFNPKVNFWQTLPAYRGCSKLYKPRSWHDDRALDTCSQNISSKSGLYFVGEGYSEEGGWVEPALRQAIDVVIHITHKTGGESRAGFKFRGYPEYDVDRSPDWERT